MTRRFWAAAALTAVLAIPCRARQDAWRELQGLAPEPVVTVAAPAAAPWASSSCEPSGTHTLCELLDSAMRCGDKSPFARTFGDLSPLDQIDTRLLVNLAKAGIEVRYDTAYVLGKGGGAIYDRDGKTLVLKESGENGLYELAHAVDDVLEPDNHNNLARTLDMIRAERQKDPENLLAGMAPFLTAWDSQFFHSAGSPEFLEAYKEYVLQTNVGKIKMSWAQDDIRRPIETFMWAFGWYASRETREKLAQNAPKLFAWVKGSLARLSAMSDEELYRTRLDKKPAAAAPSGGPRRAATLDQYCAMGGS